MIRRKHCMRSVTHLPSLMTPLLLNSSTNIAPLKTLQNIRSQKIIIIIIKKKTNKLTLVRLSKACVDSSHKSSSFGAAPTVYTIRRVPP